MKFQDDDDFELRMDTTEKHIRVAIIDLFYANETRGCIKLTSDQARGVARELIKLADKDGQ